MMKTLVALVAAAVAVSADPLAAQQSAAQQSKIIQKIIVKVNGEVFTQTELVFRQIQAIREQKPEVRNAQDLATDPGVLAALAQVTPTLLLEAVDELMLVQHGRELGVKFPEEAFTKAIEDLKKANDIKDDQTLAEALKQEGMTLADLRVNIERASIIRSVEQYELMRNMTLTEEEARQYYKAHQDQFMKPASVTLREIFIAVPTETVGGQATVNVAADEAAKARITGIRERAIKGEDFVALVAEVSESGTKANGGLIGPIAATDLNPVLSQLLDKMKTGDVSEPLRSKTGYQLLKLDSRSSAEVEPFERSREQIQQRILESRLDVEKAKFLARLRLQAVIEWKDEGYRKLYEAALAARAKTNPAQSGGAK
jgi:parvulin-like peptidyl-prolyl isomerase